MKGYWSEMIDCGPKRVRLGFGICQQITSIIETEDCVTARSRYGPVEGENHINRYAGGRGFEFNNRAAHFKRNIGQIPLLSQRILLINSDH